MRQISGADLENEVVHLDNTHFADCTLTGCTLTYTGGKIVLERTAFRGCRMLFDDAASRTVLLLQLLGHLPQAMELADITTSAIH